MTKGVLITFIVFFFLHFWDTIHIAHRVRDLGKELNELRKQIKKG